MKKIFIALLFLLSAVSVFAAKFEKPVTLTSVGQSADVQMVKALLKKAGIEAKFDKSLTAEGIKAEDELARAEKLIKAAKTKKIKIIGMHIGGEARRGELSDKFVKVAAPYCDYLIIVDEGNKDGIFTKMSSEKKIPMDTIPKITNAVDPLKKAFE